MSTTAKYKSATAPLDATAQARLWTSYNNGDSSISSLENSPELSDLVDSFYDQDDSVSSESEKSTGEMNDEDWSLKLARVVSESRLDSAAERIRLESSSFVRKAGSVFSKMEFVDWLRKKGYDAGLCKTSWTRTHRLAAGNHEYVDVILSVNTRYIVAIDLAKEFELVRPTPEYLTLLALLPEILVATPEMLKKIVKLMSSTAKQSIKSVGMHVPPWRRSEYVQAKWFSSRKRVIVEKSPVEANGLVRKPAKRAGSFTGVEAQLKRGIFVQ